MIRKTLLAAATVAFLATPALASHCPLDAAAIDAALEVSMLSDDEKDAIIALRDEGMELHNAGQHRESEQKLAEAMRLLLAGFAGA